MISAALRQALSEIDVALNDPARRALFPPQLRDRLKWLRGGIEPIMREVEPIERKHR